MSFARSLIGKALVVEKTTDQIATERELICRGCKKYDGDKCGVCGCFVELKAPMDKNKNPKAFFRVEKTHCPLGKWPYLDEDGNRHESDIEIANYYRTIDGKQLINKKTT